jgi:hypothetical protein
MHQAGLKAFSMPKGGEYLSISARLHAEIVGCTAWLCR